MFTRLCVAKCKGQIGLGCPDDAESFPYCCFICICVVCLYLSVCLCLGHCHLISWAANIPIHVYSRPMTGNMNMREAKTNNLVCDDNHSITTMIIPTHLPNCSVYPLSQGRDGEKEQIDDKFSRLKKY